MTVLERTRCKCKDLTSVPSTHGDTHLKSECWRDGSRRMTGFDMDNLAELLTSRSRRLWYRKMKGGVMEEDIQRQSLASMCTCANMSVHH